MVDCWTSITCRAKSKIRNAKTKYSGYSGNEKADDFNFPKVYSLMVHEINANHGLGDIGVHLLANMDRERQK